MNSATQTVSAPERARWEQVQQRATPLSHPGSPLRWTLDDALQLIEMNEAWTAFILANDGESSLQRAQHQPVLDGFAGSAQVMWGQIYQQLLSGGLRVFEETFLCPSPEDWRRYSLTITPILGTAGQVVALQHVSHLLEILPGNVRSIDPSIGRAQTWQVALTPEDDGQLIAAGWCRSVTAMGGDLSWIHPGPGRGQTLLFIDVCGHDAVSADVAQAIQDMSATMDLSDPGAGVSMLNQELLDFLSARSNEALFATGFILQLDLENEQLCVANFAHHAVLSTHAGIIQVSAGLPVGLLTQREPWPTTCYPFSQLGQRIVVFTDGVVEQFDDTGKMFGQDRLIEIVNRTATMAASLAVAQIVAEVDEYRGATQLKDDQSVLCIDLPATA